MNSQTTKDIPCFRSYLPDALRLRFEDKLTIRAIAQRLGLSHSTIHTLFQRFLASGIAWPLPDSVSFAQLDAILYANRKKELTEPQIREGSWRKERRTSYSREFKVRLRTMATLGRLMSLLSPFDVVIWMTDGWPLYESRLKGKLHVISKRYTQRIERHNLNLR
uniref:IS1 family transposase n=1 Tax=Shigella flexneri TaxID=623 RepID=UPI00099167EA